MAESWAIEFARQLDFTDEECEQALRLERSPKDRNQFLAALLTVSSQSISKSDSGSSGLTHQTAADTPSSSSDSSSLASFIGGISFGSNNHLATTQHQITHAQSYAKRKIYIDGSNVAKTHGKDIIFSWQGIKLCVDWFINRQHKIKVLVPEDRCTITSVGASKNESIINYLKENDILVTTPSKCNDDNFILQAAWENNGIVVSNDQFRDEKRYDDELYKFVHSNRLPYIFVDDRFMPAKDPLGRTGPTLDEFLTTNSNPLRHLRLTRSKSSRPDQPSQFYPIRQSLTITRSLPADTKKSPSNLLNIKSR